MAQKTFKVKFIEIKTVSYDQSQPAESWNLFERLELPPFVKFVPYIVNPDITALNPSSQWYGINNLVYQDNQLEENESSNYYQTPLPLPILEKDNMFYMTSQNMWDGYEGAEYSFSECVPQLQGFGTTTEGNAVTVLMPTYTTNIPLFFEVDGQQSQEETILVLPDEYKPADNGVFYTDGNQSNTIDSFTPCKIEAVAPGVVTGFYCTNAEGVDGYAISAGGSELIAVRLRDVGKLKWTEVT